MYYQHSQKKRQPLIEIQKKGTIGSLHQNAVPSLFEFRDNRLHIDEYKHIKELSNISEDNGDFYF